jgi:hypothetical protein
MSENHWTDDEVEARIQHLLQMQAMAFAWALMNDGISPIQGGRILRSAKARFTEKVDEFIAKAADRHDRGDCSCHNQPVDEAQVAALLTNLDDELAQLLQAPAKEDPSGDD